MPGFQKIFHSLSFRLIFWVGLILLVGFGAWTYYSISLQKEKAIKNIMIEADRLGNTIKLGTHYAMMHNSRDDITHITKNIGRQEGIENIRIYNKEGQIKFSNKTEEIDQKADIKAEACFICHNQDPPREQVGLKEKMRLFDSPSGYRLLGIISPIYNERGCSTNACHVHPGNKKILGLLDVVISLEATDREILAYKKNILAPAAFIFVAASIMIGLFLLRFVNRPIKNLIKETRHIGAGDFDHRIQVDRQDEIGDLALAIDDMRQGIGEKQEALNSQWHEYQALFEGVPCFITVQDRDLRLIRYNREFAEAFSPEVGDYCYRAYKDRKERCESCPVIETFKDGQPHYSEEQGINKDGTKSYWMVRTSPIKNAKGEVISAMEMSLDLTHVRWLEKEARKSEEKYRQIFNIIPNPVFVLGKDNFEILDCNERVAEIYGFTKKEILMTSFLNFFVADQREEYASAILSAYILPRVRQVRKDGQTIFVNIRVSSSEYAGRGILLVSTTDVTASLLAQQQLIQAGKMATLGEMATGIAHELNQPLSVIKTASSYLMRKVQNQEPIEDHNLKTMAEEIEGHVDRASKIINHLREFSRKSEAVKERVQVNEVLGKTLEFFSQQFKLREIEVVRDFEDTLPVIFADGNRLEQVFINLLTNARDAIEKKYEKIGSGEKTKIVTVKTRTEDRMVTIRIRDTGTGIAESVLNRIFEPFFTTKKVGQGTGIGLSISYGIVQDYDGIIKVETKEGEGTTIIVQFPIPSEAI